ncbi:MAG: dihydroorotase [Clostridia bacterium]|nr:dihydroorotase [Clostridia bacterium]
MNYIFRNAKVYYNSEFANLDIVVSDGKIAAVGKNIGFDADAVSFDCTDKYIFPGFADVHVHLREPGFIYKEIVETGTLAAAHGGYTHICAMPNLNPVPDNLETLNVELDAIKKSAVINVVPYGAITKGEKGAELAELEEMSAYVAGFSDDGRGVQSMETMRSAMLKSKELGKIIAAHCEDNSLLNGGYIHDGEYAKAHSHRGICSESEWKPIERDLRLAAETGCKYHVCHISAKESVSLIREAKKNGVDVTCETGPHYLVLNDMDLQEDGRFKMNPPIRSEADRLALIEGLRDGTIDMIATDHAPHSADEKSRGLEKSLMGVVGLETAFAVLYTELVKNNIISLEKLIELMSVNPCARFGFDNEIRVGNTADFTVFDLDGNYTVDPDKFLSKGRSTPFEGRDVSGKCIMTVCDGKIVWNEEQS